MITRIIHLSAGIITALAIIEHPIMATIATLLFLIYELDEDWHLSDKAFKDILEFAIGYYIVMTIYVVYHLV